jgi:hypothetical protein
MVTSKGHHILWKNGDGCARLPNLSRHRMSDPSSGLYGFNAIGVPVQEREIEAIAQKWVMLGGKVFLDSLQVSREGLWHPTSLR